MGWTFFDDDRRDIADILKDEFDSGNARRTITVLDPVFIKGQVAYLAVQVVTNKKTEVIALVVLVKRLKEGRFGYKDMDESMMPTFYDCPEAILNQLTPTDDSGSNKWRELCWENIGKKSYRKSDLPQQISLF